MKIIMHTVLGTLVPLRLSSEPKEGNCHIAGLAFVGLFCGNGTTSIISWFYCTSTGPIGGLSCEVLLYFN